jgi:secretion/DNA translocation related TadE-like protein
VTRGRPARDAGFATVWVVSAIALVVATAGASVGFGLVLLARHRAADAADAVALAAAVHAVNGPSAACAAGAALAEVNGVRVTDCQLDGPVATVTVTLALSGPLAAFGPAVGRARAGPSAAAEAGLIGR